MCKTLEHHQSSLPQSKDTNWDRDNLGILLWHCDYVKGWYIAWAQSLMEKLLSKPPYMVVLPFALQYKLMLWFTLRCVHFEVDPQNALTKLTCTLIDFQTSCVESWKWNVQSILKNNMEEACIRHRQYWHQSPSALIEMTKWYINN